MRFFFRGEIVLNIEELTDFLHALAFDEGSDLGAAELEEGLDIEVVGSEHDVKEQGLVDILRDILCVPLVNVLR